MRAPDPGNRAGSAGERTGRPCYQTVSIVLSNGQRIRGTRKNEDTFSIQIMDTRERLQGYLRKDVQVIEEKESLMPAFGPQRLSDSDLNDLIGYLTTLRGSQSSSDR